MALEIEFLDGRPVMEVGQKTRVRVLQQDATGRRNPMRLEHVAFTFSPVTWGRVGRTADPAVGLLEVVEVVEPDDLLSAPIYRIEASLTHFTDQAIQPERRVRLKAIAVEVELGFEVGHGDKWRAFETRELKRPIDWSQARASVVGVLGGEKRAQLVVRDGKPFLRLCSLEELPAQVSITFPNGSVAELRLEGKLAAWEPGHEPEPALIAPVVQAPAPVQVAQAPRIEPALTPAAPPEPEPELENTSFELEPVPEEETSPSSPESPALQPPLAAPVPEPARTAPGVVKEEILKMRRYVSSFTGALKAQPEGDQAQKVRERISREVERVWSLLQTAPLEAKGELLALFQSATEALPDARRVAAGLGQGAAAG